MAMGWLMCARLPSTRREAVARQNAYVLLAARYEDRYLSLVEQACGALGSAQFGDSAGDLESDVCATGIFDSAVGVGARGRWCVLFGVDRRA